MRKLKLQVQISADGYIADVNGKTDWAVWNWGETWNWDVPLQKYFVALKESVDCILLTRKMAEEGFIKHWASVAASDNPQAEFARHITAAHKVVFTKTLEQATWDNASLAKGDLAEEVNALKNQTGKDIIVYGGASFVSSLIKARLIDEFYLFINPVLLGCGMSIFQGLDSRMVLMPVESHTYACGVTVLHYKRNDQA